jgi:hypothetical protein
MTDTQANGPVLDDTLLDRLFRFEGASLRETCRLLGRPEGLPLAQFCHPQICDEALKRFAAHHPGANRAASALHCRWPARKCRPSSTTPWPVLSP